MVKIRARRGKRPREHTETWLRQARRRKKGQEGENGAGGRKEGRRGVLGDDQMDGKWRQLSAPGPAVAAFTLGHVQRSRISAAATCHDPTLTTLAVSGSHLHCKVYR